MHEKITFEDIINTAKYQKIEIQKHDIIIIRTGILNMFYEEGPEKYYSDFNEPGITYESEMVKWFYDMEIPVYATDTLGNEPLTSWSVEAVLPIHAALSRNLGIVFIEVLNLEKWAEDCAADSRYEALFIGSPLKIKGGTASPINPVIIR